VEGIFIGWEDGFFDGWVDGCDDGVFVGCRLGVENNPFVLTGGSDLRLR
jgi:hypothetical protein